MSQIINKTHRTPQIRMIVGAALLSVTLTTPMPAKAEPSLTAVAIVAGAAIVGTMLWTNRDPTHVSASSTYPGEQPAYVTQPYQTSNSYSTTGAVIYSSVTPGSQTREIVRPPQEAGIYHMAATPIAYYNQPAPAVQMAMPQYAPQMVAHAPSASAPNIEPMPPQSAKEVTNKQQF